MAIYFSYWRMKKSYIPISTYIWTFKGCGYVVVNVAIHKKMPHKLYRGCTGYIWNITKRAIGVETKKQFQMVGHKQWGFAFTRALHGIVASKPYICDDATGDDAQVPIHAASDIKTGDGLVTLPRQDIDVHKACSYLFSSILSPPKSIVFNPLLRNLYRSSEPRETILLYQRIRHAGGRLDQFSFPPILKAVSKVSALFEGMEIHGVALKIATLSDPYVETALMDMYATCGRIMCARKVFDKMSQRDIITWNTMIERYCRCGLLDEAFALFEHMKGSNVMPDEMIICNIVSACGRTGNMNYNRAIYDFLRENDVRMDAHLLTALVTMYARAGSMDMAMEFFKKMSVRNVFVSTAMISGFSKSRRLEDARLIFDQMEKKDLVCWTTMISAYAESDHPQEALRIFEKMHCSGIKPDEITMGCVISVCAKLGTLGKAKWVHRYTQLNGLESALHINNSLINMYAKCGGLDAAKEVFENMPTRNVVSWSSMINAFSMHGEATDALMLFTRMKQENVQPNEVTFIGVLYGCSHSGLVEEGKKIFASMVDEYNITPKLEHYGCMVDLYGRANRLREALEVIESMPMVPNVVIWGSLMSACRVHGELELGEFAAKKILEQERVHDGAFVFMSNIYTKEQRWDDARNVRRVMDQKNVFKKKGCSRIDINRKEQET